MIQAPATAAALAGIRVLDLTTNYAAYAGRLLADLGADVVRVEPPEGSPLRSLAPCQTGPTGAPLSFAHAFLDAGKRSVTLDLMTAAGRELLAELAASSDAMIETPSASAADHIDFEPVRQRNPGLVLVSISAFGRDGPYAGYQATDLTLLAAGGLLSLGGYVDSEPLAVQGEQAMLASGIYGAIAVLTALYERTQTGKGCWIDVSGQECVAFALEDAVAEWSINGHVRRRLGDGAREAGTGVYPCKDGHISMVAGRLGTANAFVTLTQWVAASEVPDAASLLEPQWQDFKFRQSREGIARFAEIFGAFCRTRGKQELYREGQARQIAIAPVNTVADVLQDAQLAANSYFQPQFERNSGRDITFPGPPYRLSRTPARPRGVAPKLGEHNRELVDRELRLAAGAGEA
ncbi:MAG: CoA transferase [Xanthobacteraceae bacterium]|jgi:benzylsuccinate CoA-transferase BbsE subunit